MAETYPYRLKQLELPPPPGSWESISRQLDADTSAGDGAVARKAFHAELAPPPAAWEAIANELYPEQPVAAPAKVIPFTIKRIAAAAAVIGLVLTAAWWFFGRSETTNVVAADPANKITPAPAVAPVDPSVKTKAAEGLTAAINLGSGLIKLRSPLRHSIHEVPETNTVVAVDEPSDAEFAALDAALIQPAALTGSARVSAPLLRDAKGKVILDLNLLTSSSSGGYISITGPNGEQTRISRKFANYLIYLNNENSNEEYLDFLIRNSGLWKKKFDDWRSRILNRQSFIPSSSNFLDILELKELLGENQ